MFTPSEKLCSFGEAAVWTEHVGGPKSPANALIQRPDITLSHTPSPRKVQGAVDENSLVRFMLRG